MGQELYKVLDSAREKQLKVARSLNSASEKCKAYQKLLLACQELHDHHGKIEFTLEYATYLHQLNFFEEGQKSLQTLVGHQALLREMGRYAEFLKLLHESCEQTGHLAEAIDYALRYLSYQSTKTNHPAVLAFFSPPKIPHPYPWPLCLEEIKLKSLIFMNFTQELERSISKFMFNPLLHEQFLSTSNGSGNSYGANIERKCNLAHLCEMVQTYIGDDNLSLNLKEFLIREKLFRFYSLPDLSPQAMSAKDLVIDLLNSLLEIILLNPLYFPNYLLMYFFYYKVGDEEKKKFFWDFLHKNKTNPRFIDVSRILQEVQKLKIYFKKGGPSLTPFIVMPIPEILHGAIDHFDLGEDLFASSNSQQIDRASRVAVCENKIKQLLMENKLKEAVIVQEELAGLDPDNSYLNLLQLQRSGHKKTVQDIWNSLQRDIKALQIKMEMQGEKYEVQATYPLKQQQKEAFELQLLENVYAKFAAEGIFDEHGPLSDLIVALMMTGLTKVALRLLERFGITLEFFIHKEKEEVEHKVAWQERLHLAYLYVQVLLDVQQDALALSMLEIINRTYPLNENETKCFLYLEGEILRKLNQKQKALAIYQMVANIDANYRLVQERIKEIEKS